MTVNRQHYLEKASRNGGCNPATDPLKECGEATQPSYISSSLSLKQCKTFTTTVKSSQVNFDAIVIGKTDTNNVSKDLQDQK